MSLRETLVEKAETRASEALDAARVPTLGVEGALADPRAQSASVAFLVEEETQVGSAAADPELAEALARTKSLEWTTGELSLVKALTATTIQSVLTNGSEKGRLTAAKLGILLMKIERENYLELRKQTLESQPKRRSTVFQFPSQYLGQMQAGLREGLRDVTPEKETRDA